MKLARIIGRAVATVRVKGLGDVTLQWLEPVDRHGNVRGRPFVAVDTIGSGPGELVYYITAREATLPLSDPLVPVDASIVGHVDRVRVAESGP